MALARDSIRSGTRQSSGIRHGQSEFWRIQLPGVEMSEALSRQPVVVTVEARAHGWRVDHYLARLYPNYSRALFQKAIEQEAGAWNGPKVHTRPPRPVNTIPPSSFPE